ncbi:hypothetical protein IV203_013586 [Nitzschia inconspicua]|uniref:Uncharacterized protein n=1 Tax=Nitzschia inconspicua TaxID=303405 RepID=A0A9K3M8Y1_9STRA|nr:hypothetical protein IV203_013586 [Nitzschia inconspicua]
MRKEKKHAHFDPSPVPQAGGRLSYLGQGSQVQCGFKHGGAGGALLPDWMLSVVRGKWFPAKSIGCIGNDLVAKNQFVGGSGQ